MTATQLGLPGNKHYLTLQARIRKQRLGTAVIAEAASTVRDLEAPGAANHAIRVNPPIPDGDFLIVTYYYDIAIEDSVTGIGTMRLRVNIE